MKRKNCLYILILIALALMACGKSTAEKWQEQYNLGMKYLEEQKYAEAVIAFTSAIELDEKEIHAYSGLVDTYQQMGFFENAVNIQQKLISLGQDSLENQLKLAELMSNINLEDGLNQLRTLDISGYSKEDLKLIADSREKIMAMFFTEGFIEAEDLIIVEAGIRPRQL